MELDENGKVDVSLFPGSRSIAASIMQRPAYDAGSTKRPLLLEPIVGSGSDDDGLDFVSASFINEIVEKGYGVHLDKGVADCPFCEEMRESEKAGLLSRHNLKTIHGLDAEAELAAIIAAEIKTELAKHKTQWDELADAWVAVVSNPSLQNLQALALKWYFGEWAFNEVCTEWLAEKKVMVSPGICIYDTCGWIEGWGKVEGESHEDYHRWHQIQQDLSEVLIS